MSKNKTTIYDLNNDCIQHIINKLSLKEIFKLEKVDKRFQFNVKEVLKRQKVLRFGENEMFCKHSANNSIQTQLDFDINCDQIKPFFEKCPNIKCLQMSCALINKSLFECISNNFKQLVCIHFYCPKSDSNSPQIEFKDIGKLLSDKIEVEINFGNRYVMREDSIIALIQNMPQIKDIAEVGEIDNDWYLFPEELISIQELISHFGRNIRSLSINSCDVLTVNHLNAINNNTNLVELRINNNNNNCQQIFDFVCNNFIQLKSFGFDGFESISISNIIKLINLENLKLDVKNIIISSMDKNNCFNKLLSLELRNISMGSYSLQSLLQKLPNIEKLSLLNYHLFNKQNNESDECLNRCNKVFESLSKLNRLKVLQINGKCVVLKALRNSINEQTFKQLQQLNICYVWSRNSKLDQSKQLFHLFQSLTQLCDTNNKQLFTFKIDQKLMQFITEKQTINGIEYNVLFDCEKFETNFGQKFEIPKNMRIIEHSKCVEC